MPRAIEKYLNKTGLEKDFTLPSRGVLYGAKLPGGVIRLRPINTMDEKLLVRGAGGKVLERIIQRCILTKTLMFDELLVSDKQWLLFALRGFSYGEEYKFTLKCGSCSTQNPMTIHLPGDIRVALMDESDVEPYTAVLPVCGAKVSLRLLRVSDEEAIMNSVRATPTSVMETEGDPTYMQRLARHITAIDGEEIDLTEALQLSESLVGADSAAIWAELARHDCPPDVEIEMVCRVCGAEWKDNIPVNEEFFRPGITAASQ